MAPYQIKIDFKHLWLNRAKNISNDEKNNRKHLQIITDINEN